MKITTEVPNEGAAPTSTVIDIHESLRIQVDCQPDRTLVSLWALAANGAFANNATYQVRGRLAANGGFKDVRLDPCSGADTPPYLRAGLTT